EAIRRYEELGRQTASTDHALSIRAFSQAQCLREGNHGSVPPNYQRGNPTDVYYGSSTSASRPATIPIHPVSPPTTAYASGTATPGAPAQSPSAPPPAEWRAGWIGRSSVVLYGQRLYVLQDQLGQLLLYVLPSPGMNLEAYVNRPVYLYGSVRYESQLRRDFLTPTRPN